MKAINLLVCCFVLVIFMITDAHAAPIVLDNECTICCEQADCIWLCDTLLSSSIVILTDILDFNVAQCNGDTLCQNAAIIQYNQSVSTAYNDNLFCVMDCVSIHP